MLSVRVDVLVTSKTGKREMPTTVGSSIVFPSVSSASSLTSVTSFVFPGELPVTVTEFLIPPVCAAACCIT